MTSQLDRKLWRDIARMKGQVLAVAMVMACGLAMLVMARSLIFSLESTSDAYYRGHRFAEVFAVLKRAPLGLADRIRGIPGVAAVQPGLSVQVTLDIPGLDEPASGNVRSLPDSGEPELNRLFLRRGRGFLPGGRREVLVSEAFAEANRLSPGDSVAMLLNGRRQSFRVAGIVLSPEFIFESRPGAALPDNRTYGIFWLPYDELAHAFDLHGAFNSVSLTLAPGASDRPVVAALDTLLEPYGGRGAFGRADHPSHIRVRDEIGVLRTLSVAFPVVFLGVAAFMVNAVLSRLLNLQREQIAILKAFGFSNRAIVGHYLKFALVMVAVGTVLGGFGGMLLGRRLVVMYRMWFRFPDLSFHLDRGALLVALAVAALAAVVGVFGAVRRAARLPPAEAMRPEPPANFRRSVLERTGVARLFSHSFRIAVRNLERRPAQALFTVAGLALATGILIVPNCFRDSVAHILGFQWDVTQRQDVSVGLIEPQDRRARDAFLHLPGVLSVEAFRSAPARIRFGGRSRQVGLQGLDPAGGHTRIIAPGTRELSPPADGVVLSAKLAEVLGARIGDRLRVEVLEGRRPRAEVTLVGLADDMAGLNAYLAVGSLNRLLHEGDLVNGASFTVDPLKRDEFLRALKGIPRIGWVAIKESLRRNFEQTTAASINLIQTIYLTFATVVAFGVVYNNARISLSERARELATLRVVGFTQSEVAGVLVAELAILATLAVPVGLLLGTGFATGIVTQVNTETVRLPLILTARNYAFAVLVVTAASTLSGVLVLRRLRRLDLVGALRAPE